MEILNIPPERILGIRDLEEPHEIIISDDEEAPPVRIIRKLKSSSDEEEDLSPLTNRKHNGIGEIRIPQRARLATDERRCSKTTEIR